MRNEAFRRRIWNEAVAAAGLPPSLTPHDLRDTAASLMLQATGDLYYVKEQLGHSSVKVTERYAHTYPGSGSQKAALLDELYRAATIDHVGLARGSADRTLVAVPAG